MLISKTEAEQLAQLVDSEHTLGIKVPARVVDRVTLDETPEHEWALAEVRDWRSWQTRWRPT